MFSLILALLLGQAPPQQGGIVPIVQPTETLSRWPAFISIEWLDANGRWWVASGANSINEANQSLPILQASFPQALAWRYR